jgi:Single-strand binding protein family.
LLTGNLAHIGQNLLSKGNAILVWGAINVRSYEKESIRRWITELSADNFQILRKRKKDENKVIATETLNISTQQKVSA